MQEYQNIKTFLQITQNNLCYLKNKNTAAWTYEIEKLLNAF